MPPGRSSLESLSMEDMGQDITEAATGFGLLSWRNMRHRNGTEQNAFRLKRRET